MIKSRENGFTLVELLVVIALAGILASTGCLANYIKAKDKAREAELKANIHTIQIALERYATDHSGRYPNMIWGGDEKGWTPVEGVGCRTMWESEHPPYFREANPVSDDELENEDTPPSFTDNEEDAAPPSDPLIYFGYMTSYPRNPFLNYEKDEGLTKIISRTGPSNCKFGDGDPRFGFDGSIMGNILEDPRYLWRKPDQLTRIKNCFLDEASQNNISMVNENAPVNPMYSMGGIPEWKSSGSGNNQQITGSDITSGRTLKTYWPGEFFYRSGGSFLFPQDFLLNSPESDRKYIWDFYYARIDRYILGGFGSIRTDGMDLIRLTDVDGSSLNNIHGYMPDCFYEPHPDYKATESKKIHISSPEIFGGGERGKMPVFPYINPGTGEWLYGAPDGYRDGIVIGLTSGTDKAGEW